MSKIKAIIEIGRVIISTIKDICIYGFDGARKLLDKKLYEVRMEYFKKFGKFPE